LAFICVTFISASIDFPLTIMRKHSPGFADWMPNIDVREVAAYDRGAESLQNQAPEAN
jgi:hypothetical protein